MKIICIGDSFTKGFGVKPNESWFSQLQSDKFEFINKGINGDTTSGMLSRFAYDVISEKPKYVLITGGINDFISGSNNDIPQNNYMAMVHQAFNSNIIPIIGIEPDFDTELIRRDWACFTSFDDVHEKFHKFHQWLIKFCHTFGVYYIDLYNEFEKIKKATPDINYYSDGLHLTPDGHTAVHHIIQQYFNETL